MSPPLHCLCTGCGTEDFTVLYRLFSRLCGYKCRHLSTVSAQDAVRKILQYYIDFFSRLCGYKCRHFSTVSAQDAVRKLKTGDKIHGYSVVRVSSLNSFAANVANWRLKSQLSLGHAASHLSSRTQNTICLKYEIVKNNVLPLDLDNFTKIRQQIRILGNVKVMHGYILLNECGTERADFSDWEISLVNKSVLKSEINVMYCSLYHLFGFFFSQG